MYKFNLVVLCFSISFSQAIVFHTIDSVMTSTSGDHYAVNRLIQGEGFGFDANSLESLGTFNNNAWVTNSASGGYFSSNSPIELIFDLGSDVTIGEISTWGYANDNNNGARNFSLQFATDAEGNTGFGTSISYNPDFVADQDPTSRDDQLFSEKVFARYIKMIITSNYNGTPGNGGGDRVGLHEVAFSAVPEPSSAMLLGLALAGNSLRRKKL